MARLLPLLVLIVSVTFAVSPFFVTNFAGFDPNLFPVPQENPPVQPAGWAFAIWGLLYVWLIVSAGYGLLKRADHPQWQPARPWLFLSLGLGTFWLAMAEQTVLGATILIWVMLILALKALWATPKRDRWWLQAPVATYAGWLTAASSVSVGLVLGGWGLMDQTAAALVALVIALVLGLGVQLKLGRAPGYGAALIWALAAVVARNANPVNTPVAALAALGVIALVVALVMVRRKRKAAATA